MIVVVVAGLTLIRLKFTRDPQTRMDISVKKSWLEGSVTVVGFEHNRSATQA